MEPFLIAILVLNSINTSVVVGLGARKLYRYYKEYNNYMYKIDKRDNAELYYQLVKHIAPVCKKSDVKATVSFGNENLAYIYSIPDINETIEFDYKGVQISATSRSVDNSIITSIDLMCPKKKRWVLDEFLASLVNNMKQPVKEFI
jgi:hypothetical protein